MKSSIYKKKALVVGTGQWGKIFINFLIRKKYLVYYANRTLETENELEKKYSYNQLKIFEKDNNEVFDILIFCLRPEDIIKAWKFYRHYSENILIEKPGPIKYKAIQDIIKWCQRYKKKLLINYEYYYTETALYLRKIFIENHQNIKDVKLFWKKDLGDGGNLNWRLFPHLLSEIYFGNENFEILDYFEDRFTIFAKGYLGNIPFELNIANSKDRIHGIKIQLRNNHSYLKNEKALYYDQTLIIKNDRSELEQIIYLFEKNDYKLFEDNHSMSMFIVKVLETLLDKSKN